MGIRIREIELINFANLYTGLGITNLHIDLSKQANVVCVIIGKNGRGKTSLLSYMTPFAGIGNIEARDNSNLILAKKKGYKKMIMENDAGNLYEIQHFYQPTDDKSDEGGHTIKSYISIDGAEMNSNGNVTSFRLLVREYLGIEPDYLRLIRVGDNVQNLIRSKDTERKVFMGKIIEDVDVYLKQNKKMSKISTEVKAIIGHLTDGITKTGITNIDTTKSLISELQSEIESLNTRLLSETDNRSRIQYEIDLIAFPGDGASVIKDLEAKVSSYASLRSKVSDEETSETLSEKIHDLEIQVIKKESRVNAISDNLQFILDRVDGATNKKLSLIIEFEKEEKRLDLSTMRLHVASLQKQVNETYDIRFDEDRPIITKGEYDDFMVTLRNVQDQLNHAYEFGKNVISDVVDHMSANEDVPAIVRSSLLQLEAVNRSDKLALIDRLIDKYAGRAYSCDRSEKCVYKMLHDDLLSIKDTIPVGNVTKDESYYYAMKGASDVIRDALDLISNKATILKKLPDELQDIFLLDRMFSHMRKLELIYDDTVVNKWASFITDIYNYDQLVETLEKQKAQLKVLEETSREVFISKQIDEVMSEIAALTEKKEELIDEMSGLSEEITELKSSIDIMSAKKEALEQYENVKTELDSMLEKRDKHQNALSSLFKQNAVIDSISNKIKQLASNEKAVSTALDQYIRLDRELKTYLKVQDRYDHLKYATSNRSGLPLFSIELYLQDTVRLANELLDIVYDGELYLCPFDISDTKFRMPFIRKGIKIPDVMYASQGEQSFLNMALSSALRVQSMEEYNIALFDEVDGVFDDDNRQKVIPVLDKQLEMSKTRQAFLITHNNMFDQYPTDVINFDNLDASTVPIKWS